MTLSTHKPGGNPASQQAFAVSRCAILRSQALEALRSERHSGRPGDRQNAGAILGRVEPLADGRVSLIYGIG